MQAIACLMLELQAMCDTWSGAVLYLYFDKEKQQITISKFGSLR